MKTIRFLFSPVFMGILFFVFAAAMAIATFIENDFGSSASYGLVYNTRWFELIMVLLAANLTGQLIIHKLFRKNKLPVALFHLSFLLMITGAGITRYTGWEGTIHIREGETENACYSNDNYLSIRVKDNKGEIVAEDTRLLNISSLSSRKHSRTINDGNEDYELILSDFIPNAAESIKDSPDGDPVVSLLVTREIGRGVQLILRRGESQSLFDFTIGFESPEETDVKIWLDSGNFLIKSKYGLSMRSMMSDETAVSDPGMEMSLKLMQVIIVRDLRIVPRALSPAGEIIPAAADPEQQNTGQNALVFDLSGGNETKTVYVWDRQEEYFSVASIRMGGNEFEISYGSGIKKLPFELRLNDFILERYPGSASPSGYKSDVTVTDTEKGTEKPSQIFMNNILKYRGFRFYQSSFDQDEKGTVLSVNHDMAGMMVTYTGYGLLFLFIILSLVIRSSSFRNIEPSAWSSSLRRGAITLFFILIVSGLSPSFSQNFIPDKESSDELGKILVQDQKGRTKPLFALSNDILRKVARENKFEGNTSMQVFLGLFLDFANWQDVPLIKVSNKDLQKSLGINNNLAAFSDLVDMRGRGAYKLAEQVDAVYQKSPGERDKKDKEIMKVDERVNIVYMIYRGNFLKMFPLKDGTRNWGSPDEAIKTAMSREDSAYLHNIIPLLAEALQSGNNAAVRQLTESVLDYQERFAGYNLPSDLKIQAEVVYYRMGIFERLFPFYAGTGLIMLIILIANLISGRKNIALLIRLLTWLLLTGFLLHTFGLGLRWYISGHSPMSNGYESMIFISWVTLLAGFIFNRKSVFTLPATAVLAGLTLLVAHMSFMDPEITSLVPVLQSYWLTLHVSVITGSYGFLGLGAIIGIINLILISLSGTGNRERISDTVDELTVINFKTLTLGLYFLTIGTFLGAIWANESWGRYWGWDPKETWSLITIIIYAFVTHSRQIQGFKDIYSFNILSLFSFSSVLMTYFGVNYYLSGLHSYAGGDPAPVPAFVYIVLFILISLSITAYLKYKGWKKHA
ncbi:MAG: c-type cytochrome biogenesis protein CcsB [Bacteroidetes bacterium RBG_13_43_22]|nr:MAG: c-type cytochrome biogenesis protein CcsB [Bacteroidetes bacterium RBG_13_43_22]